MGMVLLPYLQRVIGEQSSLSMELSTWIMSAYAILAAQVSVVQSTNRYYDGTYWRVNSAIISINHATISDNNTPGVYLGSGTGIVTNVVVHNSNIISNTNYGIYNSSSAYPVDARYNWWGDASGPAPIGTGDAINYRTVCDPTCHNVYDLVLVDPWIGSPVSDSLNSSPSTFWTIWNADPVNMVFGNYIHQATDLSILNRGVPFNFQRTYNSNSTYNGPLGLGWTHSYNMAASETTTGTVQIRQPDGRIDAYLVNTDGSYYTTFRYL